MTLLIAPVIGIASALLTILLTPTLQHYFWTRQRQAERQLATITELNRLISEFFVRFSRHDDRSAQGPFDAGIDLEQGLATVAADVQALFSAAAFQVFKQLYEALIPPPGPSPYFSQIVQARALAIKALYKEVGIPAPALDEWFRRQVGQPLQTQVWDRPQQYWRQRCRPALQRWGRQAQVWGWDHPQQYWRISAWPMLQRWAAQARMRIRRP